jgi:hypothetical protein
MEAEKSKINIPDQFFWWRMALYFIDGATSCDLTWWKKFKRQKGSSRFLKSFYEVNNPIHEGGILMT